jgi:hypothetical protein
VWSQTAPVRVFGVRFLSLDIETKSELAVLLAVHRGRHEKPAAHWPERREGVR